MYFMFSKNLTEINSFNSIITLQSVCLSTPYFFDRCSSDWTGDTPITEEIIKLLAALVLLSLLPCREPKALTTELCSLEFISVKGAVVLGVDCTAVEISEIIFACFCRSFAHYIRCYISFATTLFSSFLSLWAHTRSVLLVASSWSWFSFCLCFPVLNWYYHYVYQNKSQSRHRPITTIIRLCLHCQKWISFLKLEVVPSKLVHILIWWCWAWRIVKNRVIFQNLRFGAFFI